MIPFAKLLMKLSKESGDDPVKFLSMWGQLFLVDTVVAYSTNILFEKPGILLKCALDHTEDDTLRFWFDNCFPGGYINKASEEEMEKAVVCARSGSVPDSSKTKVTKGYTLSY
jgi:hypothetical protein